MKKMIPILLVLVMLFTGCGSTKPTAEDAVDEAMEAVKTMDSQTMAARFDKAPLELEEMDMDDETLSLLMQDLTYQVISCEENGNNATATLEITNLDMEQVMEAYLAAALQDVFENLASEIDSLTEEELDARYEKILHDTLASGEIETVTSTVEVNMTYTEDGGWVMQTSNEFTDAILGGLKTYADTLAMSQLAGEMGELLE
jgi:hypothetical protein